MKSKFQGAQVMLCNGDPIEQLRMKGSNLTALSSATGEINAYDRKELAVQLGNLMMAVASGEIVNGDPKFANASNRDQMVSESRELILEAYSNPEAWASLGADLAVTIQECRERQSFMRRLNLSQNLRQGELPRILTNLWDSVAVVATGPANIQHQIIRNKQFFPSEFEIVGNVRVENIELQQVGGDLMDQLFNQGMDAMMVQEDRLWKRAADATVGTVNPLVYIVGQLTPQNLAALRQGVTDWNLPTTTAVISNDFWQDIIGNNDFAQFLDPVTKYDLALNGQLGTLVGLNLTTDGFRQPNQKVLGRGEIYVVATPEHHGCYSDRGGIQSTPTSGADSGSTSRGWLFNEVFSYVLANPRSVSKGKRA